MKKDIFFVLMSMFLCTNSVNAFWSCSSSKQEVSGEQENLVASGSIDDTIRALPKDPGSGALHLIHEAITTVNLSTDVTKVKEHGVRQPCWQFTSPADSDVRRTADSKCIATIFPPDHPTFASITLFEMGKKGSTAVQPAHNYFLKVKPGTSLTTTLTLDKTACTNVQAVKNGYPAIQKSKTPGKKDTFSISLPIKLILITEFAAMAKQFEPYQESAGDSVEVRESAHSTSDPCERKTN